VYLCFSIHHPFLLYSQCRKWGEEIDSLITQAFLKAHFHSYVSQSASYGDARHTPGSEPEDPVQNGCHQHNSSGGRQSQAREDNASGLLEDERSLAGVTSVSRGDESPADQRRAPGEELDKYAGSAY
jgi:hypothetical protein